MENVLQFTQRFMRLLGEESNSESLHQLELEVKAAALTTEWRYVTTKNLLISLEEICCSVGVADDIRVILTALTLKAQAAHDFAVLMLLWSLELIIVIYGLGPGPRADGFRLYKVFVATVESGRAVANAGIQLHADVARLLSLPAEMQRLPGAITAREQAA